jgi:hypothetical protein
LNKKEKFIAEFFNWKSNAYLKDPKLIYQYVINAEYTDLALEIKRAMLNYIEVDPDSFNSDSYRKQLGLAKESFIKRIINWFNKDS